MTHYLRTPQAIYTLSIIAILILLGLLEPKIFSILNLQNVSNQYAYLAIFAVGQAFCLLVKGLDLSQGGTIAITGVCTALLSVKLGVYPAMCLGVLIATGVGCINGMIIAILDVSPFVVTLGTGYLFTGVALILSGGIPVYNVPTGFDTIGWEIIFGFPLVFICFLTIILLASLILKITKYGRYLYATGSNKRAAYLNGINTKKVTVFAYMTSASMTGIGSIFMASRISSGHPLEGSNIALQSVAACVIGGVSLFGGKGSMLGVALGALLLTMLANTLNIFNFTSYVQQVVVGIIIILAVIIDRFKNYEQTI